MSADARTQFNFVEAYWQQLVSLEEHVVRKAARKVARRRRARLILLTLLGLAGAAGIAVAAAQWIFGNVSAPVFPTAQYNQLGTLAPGEDRLVSLRVADPSGGPAWGIRAIKFERDIACLQVGRVVEDQLVALGVAGAFGDDRRAHRLPPEGEACGALPSPGKPARLGGVSQVRALHGLPGVGCGETSCGEAERRTILFGLLGSRAAGVEMRFDGRRYRVSTRESVYLFVLSGDIDVGNARLILRLRDGRECELDNPGATPQHTRNHNRSPIRPRCDVAALT